jgi:hypothetical protein
MPEVKRYFPSPAGTMEEAGEIQNGYVRWADYEALQAKLSALAPDTCPNGCCQGLILAGPGDKDVIEGSNAFWKPCPWPGHSQQKGVKGVDPHACAWCGQPGTISWCSVCKKSCPPCDEIDAALSSPAHPSQEGTKELRRCAKAVLRQARLGKPSSLLVPLLDDLQDALSAANTEGV